MNTPTAPGATTPGHSALTRRTLLGGTAAGLVVGVAGCSGATIPLFSSPDPDDEVRRRVVDSERVLIEAYDRVIAANPALGGRLQLLRDQHQAHVNAVTADLDPATLATPSASQTATAGTANGVRALRRMEVAAAKQRIEACSAATATDLAELLARIAASESGHAAALTGRGV